MVSDGVRSRSWTTSSAAACRSASWRTRCRSAINRIELHPTVKDKWGRPVAYIIKDWHPHDVALMDTMARHVPAILRVSAAIRPTNIGIQGAGRSTWPRTPSRAWPTTSWAAPASAPTAPTRVLDPDCRAWDFDNLYVTDGAFMPTSGGANPTLTIQANSFRVADHLLTRI